MKHDFRILTVDDDPELLQAIFELLVREGYFVERVAGGKEALARIHESAFDLIVSDLLMPEVNGIDLLKKIKQSDSETAVVLVTGHSAIEDAVKAIRLGAEDYITKPFDNIELLMIVRRLYENKELKQRAEILRQEMLRQNLPDIIGESRQIKNVLSEIKSVAGSDASVLITGESGTGKELVARAVHSLSGRSKQPFVAINAAAVPENLLESEFFGHEKGAFSGATERKYGLFEIADKGTLFLDEIAEMPLDLQAKLLRTVETKRLRRLGGTQEVEVDFRIIAATNRTLKEEVTAKRFREDLFFRLNTFCITVPPLRERKNDIPLLANAYLKRRGYHQVELTEDFLEALAAYDWPGNVRELENAIERAVLLSRNQSPRLKHLSPEIQTLYRKRHETESQIPAKLEEIEKEHILKVFDFCEKDKVKTAKILGIGLKTLYRKLDQYGVS